MGCLPARAVVNSLPEPSGCHEVPQTATRRVAVIGGGIAGLASGPNGSPNWPQTTGSRCWRPGRGRRRALDVHPMGSKSSRVPQLHYDDPRGLELCRRLGLHSQLLQTNPAAGGPSWSAAAGYFGCPTASS